MRLLFFVDYKNRLIFLSCDILRISLIYVFATSKYSYCKLIKQSNQPIHTFFSHFCTHLLYIESNGKEGKVHEDLVLSKMSETFVVHIVFNLSEHGFRFYASLPSVFQSFLSDERSLVLRLIEGDEDAFCELYAAYKNRLIYFAMRFLKSREYAEDIFQDAFAVVWQGRRFINPDASFSAYLYTIVRNRILNQLRDLSNQDKLREQILSQAVNYTNETKDEIIANDLRQFISRALQQLTPRQREIFQMSRERQMSHREIAEVLGISVNTVQESISISLRTLRTYLEKNSIVSADLILLLVCLNL